MRASTEPNKYEHLGDYHWKSYRAGTIYSQHARHVRNRITEHRILDAGGGDGLIAYLLQRAGHDVELVDSDPVAVVLAVKHGIKARIGSVYKLRGRYDAVYCGDVLEHLSHPGRAVAAFARVAPVCYIATPPRTPAGDLHDLRHVREWTAEELRRFMARRGWRQAWSVVRHERILAKFHRVPWWRRCLSAVWPSI